MHSYLEQRLVRLERTRQHSSGLQSEPVWLL